MTDAEEETTGVDVEAVEHAADTTDATDVNGTDEMEHGEDVTDTEDDVTDTDGAAEPSDEQPAVDLAAILDEGPVLFFDGVCNLCNGAVQFVIDHDSQGKIRFASLQSDVGSAVLDRLDLPQDDLETVVLVEGDRAYTKSAAAIRVCELLGGVYGLARVGWLLPRRVRDWAYDTVAENRYQWFGRKDQCMVPTPELRSRFVE